MNTDMDTAWCWPLAWVGLEFLAFDVSGNPSHLVRELAYRLSIGLDEEGFFLFGKPFSVVTVVG